MLFPDDETESWPADSMTAGRTPPDDFRALRQEADRIPVCFLSSECTAVSRSASPHRLLTAANAHRAILYRIISRFFLPAAFQTDVAVCSKYLYMIFRCISAMRCSE